MSVNVETHSGYEAMGHPIPPRRMSNAYVWLKGELGYSTEEAMTLIGRVGDALERDEPYEAMRLATSNPVPREESSPVSPVKVPGDMKCLDQTGGYRLFAILLTS